MYSLQFLARKRPNGLAVVYYRVLANGKRWGSDLSTHISGPAVDWEPGVYRFAGRANVDINKRLAAMETSLYQSLAALEMQGRVSIQDAAAALAAPAKTRHTSLADICARWAACKAAGKAASTAATYRFWVPIIGRGLAWLGHQPGQPVTDADLRRLDTWLQSPEGGSNREAVSRKRKLARLCAALHWAMDAGLHPTQPVPRWRPKAVCKPPVFLQPHQVQALAAVPDSDLKTAKDFWLFCCHTGLAYCDARAFDPALHLVPGPGGGPWLSMARQKSGEPCLLPYSPEAQAIAAQYGGRAPRLGNAKANLKLKTLAARAGVSINLTTHIARKTKAAALLNSGLSEQTVCKMMGWSGRQMIRLYARVTMRGIADDLARVGLL